MKLKTGANNFSTEMLGFLHSILRKDEKLLLRALKDHDLQIKMIDVRSLSYPFENQFSDIDVVIQRVMSATKGLYAVKMVETLGLPCVNSYQVAKTCSDKILTSLAFDQNEIPQPRYRVVLDTEFALTTIEEMGYPVVIKPVIGSWGRLLAKINDRDAAEAVLEHKNKLGHFLHNIIYLQEYIEKEQKDIRAFIVGNECVAAIYRYSEHWITNTARGGKAEKCEITPKLEKTAVDAAMAVGGGVIAVDLVEVNNEYVVLEANHTMEYKNSIKTTGVDIPSRIAEYIVERYV